MKTLAQPDNQPSEGLQRSDNWPILSCFYHDYQKAEFKVEKFNETINLCRKCTIKEASLGHSVTAFQSCQNHPKEDSQSSTNFVKNLRSTQVSSIIKRMQNLSLAYLQKRNNLNFINKSYQARQKFLIEFYGTLVRSLRGMFCETSQEMRREIQNSRLWQQRTYQSLILMSKVMLDLKNNIEKYNQLQGLNLNSDQSSYFYHGVLTFYEHQYSQIDQQMSNSPDFSIGSVIPRLRNITEGFNTYNKTTLKVQSPSDSSDL